MLNQNERQPLSVAEQVASIYAGIGGFLDRLTVDRVHDFLDSMLSRLKAENKDLLGRIDEGELSDEDEEALGKAIGEAVDDFGPDLDEEGQPLEAGESDRIRSEEERARGRHVADEDEGEEGEGEESSEAEETEEVPA